jgi:hypothetical protein
LYYFHKNKKTKTKKTFVVGFFGWVFLVGFLLPTLAGGISVDRAKVSGGKFGPE